MSGASESQKASRKSGSPRFGVPLAELLAEVSRNERKSAGLGRRNEARQLYTDEKTATPAPGFCARAIEPTEFRYPAAIAGVARCEQRFGQSA
jgi:hypothetical protein